MHTIYMCVHKKYNFKTGSQRTPENKKRDLVTWDGNGNDDDSSGHKNIKTGLKEVKKKLTSVWLSGDCLATYPCVLSCITNITNWGSLFSIIINEATALKTSSKKLLSSFKIVLLFFIMLERATYLSTFLSIKVTSNFDNVLRFERQ